MSNLGNAHRLGRLGAGLGAEGKIKAGVHPWLLTRCLHIFFGVHSVRAGVHPFFPQTTAITGIEGVHPLQFPSVYAVWR